MSELIELKSKFQRLVELRETRDADAKQADKSNAAYRSYEAELYQELRDAGMQGRVGFDFGGDIGVAKFQLRATIYGRVVDKEAAVAALRREGLDEVILDESVREGRLNELVRDRLESKLDLPDGIDYYPREGIAISRK